MVRKSGSELETDRVIEASAATAISRVRNRALTAVDGLDNLDALLPAVKELGVHHAAYGVKDEHYAPVGEALIWTLRESLGVAAFKQETADAWAKFYGLVSGIMKSAA